MANLEEPFAFFSSRPDDLRCCLDVKQETLTHSLTHSLPDAVAELVECRLPVREVENLIPGRVKSMTYRIDTCHYLAWLMLSSVLG